VVLRTPTSISRGNAPLFVVDGVILASTFDRSTTDLSSLDIESIEVVKGAAAASLYGSRAANGVIQIRTRRGAAGWAGRNADHGADGVRREPAQPPDEPFEQPQLSHERAGAVCEYRGNVVEREQRVLRPGRRSDSSTCRTLDPTFDHIDQFFNPGSFMVNSVTLAGARKTPTSSPRSGTTRSAASCWTTVDTAATMFA
jgi:TonB-dependent SusC/RagA subfamily outer membrane receptor